MAPFVGSQSIKLATARRSRFEPLRKSDLILRRYDLERDAPQESLRLPMTKDTPLVRVDFRDDTAWALLCERVMAPVGEFRAYVECVSTLECDGASPAQLASAVPEQGVHSILLVADDRALNDPEHPVLVVDLTSDLVRTFRVLPHAVWSVENNLSIANMDFDEFLGAVDEDGVFRGFPEDR